MPTGTMLKSIGKGLLVRLLAYSVLGAGFWLLYQGFLLPNILVGILGGLMIPAGMYLIVTARRGAAMPADAAFIDLDQEQAGEEEEDHVDSIDRGR